MAINYNIIARTEPGIAGGGKKKYYAVTTSKGRSTLKDLTKIIEKTTTASGADIRLVVYALVDTIVDELANGRIVELGDLGIIRLSLQSKGKDNPKDITHKDITGAKTVFTPGSMIKEMLKELEFKRVKMDK